MINQELVFYIKEQLRFGRTKDEVRQVLEGEGGWIREDIEEAFKFIVTPPEPAGQVQGTRSQVLGNAENNTQDSSLKQTEVKTGIAPKVETKVSATASPFLNSLKQSPSPVAPQNKVEVKPEIKTEAIKPIDSEKKVTPTPVSTADEPKILFEKVTSSGNATDISIKTDKVAPANLSNGSFSKPVSFETKPTPKFSGMQASSMLEKAKPQTHSIRKVLGFIVLLLLLGGLGVGGVFAYNNYIQPSPEKVLEGISSGVVNSNSIHFVMKADYSSSLGEQMIGSLNIDGTLVKSNDSYNTHIKSSLKTPDSVEEINFEIMRIGTDVYAKLPKIITDFISSTVNIPETEFQKYIHFGQSDMTLAGEELGSVAMGINPDEIFKTASGAPKKIVELFSTNQFLSLGKTLKIETKNGEPLRAYEVVFDEGKFKSFMNGFMLEISGEEVLTEIMKRELDESIGSISITKGEIWVGTFSHKLHKISFTLEQTAGGATNKINFEFVVDGYGSSAEITRPNNVFEFGDFLNQYKILNSKSEIERFFSQIKIQSEVYFSAKKNYTNFCTDPDALKNSLDYIFESTGINPNCSSTNKGYIVTSPLPGETNLYICTDQKGKVVTLPGIPTGVLCQ